MNLDDFILEYIEEVRRDSKIQNDTPHNVFLEKMSEQLQSMEYIFNPTILPFYKAGTNQRLMQFDLYAYDEIDKSFVLLLNDYNDDESVQNLTQSEIDKLSSRMLNYIQETYSGTVFKFIDPSQDAYKLASELEVKLKKDYVDADNDDSIEKIKLFIVTNKKISKSVKNTKLDDFQSKRVELNVWDIERIYDVIVSGRDKEPVIIDFERITQGKGIEYLKADFGHIEDYDAYLSILPGQLLSDIYWEHGSRLLEGNVRAFLSNKGKVNKGIRNTIKKEPGKFFTYNNGIACTAKEVHFSVDGKYITKIEDLQIINGGQTTASLTTAWNKDKAPLDNIFVPMKLTIIKSDQYDDMIQNISRYANSQNKVTDADLFSNHPYHREFEKMSIKIPAPPKQGENHNTFWYYERSRGKYQQSKFKLNTDSKLKDFERRYPKKQVIVKEDLAKYLMAGIYLRPDWVSRGRAKNMTEFAHKIHEQWLKDRTVFNEKYFKDAISYAILYKFVDNLVANADWYLKGGIKLNIVPYTISKILSNLPNGFMIDINRIWREQTVYQSLASEINRVAKMADQFINDSKGVIATENAKKEDTWKRFKEVEHTFSREFINDLVSIEMLKDQMNAAKKSVKVDAKVNLEIEIYKLAQLENKTYWQRLLDEGLRRGLISYSEENVIKIIMELAKPNPKKIPSEMQYKIAWAVRKKLEDKGVLV
jgi:hypothetical protein